MRIGERTYLGDAVYVEHDGYQVWLVTTDGIRDTNSIALEPSVLAAFEAWLKSLNVGVEAAPTEEGK